MPSHSVPSCTANTVTVQTSKPAACYWSLMVPGKCLINQRKDLHCSLLGDNSFSCSHWSISVMISLLIATFCRNYQALVSAPLRCREKGSRFKKKTKNNQTSIQGTGTLRRPDLPLCSCCSTLWVVPGIHKSDRIFFFCFGKIWHLLTKDV